MIEKLNLFKLVRNFINNAELARNMHTRKENLSILFFAERFLETAGIEAKLAEGSSARLVEGRLDDYGTFKTHPEFVWNEIYFQYYDYARQVFIKYHRVIADETEEALEKSDLQKVIGIITKNNGYNIEYVRNFGNGEIGFRISTEVRKNNTKKFAQILGTIDKVVTLYLNEIHLPKHTSEELDKCNDGKCRYG